MSVPLVVLTAEDAKPSNITARGPLLDEGLTFDVSPTASRRRTHSSQDRGRSPALTVRPRLVGLVTAVPPHVMGQNDVAQRVRALFAEVGDDAIERLMPVYSN